MYSPKLLLIHGISGKASLTPNKNTHNCPPPTLLVTPLIFMRFRISVRRSKPCASLGTTTFWETEFVVCACICFIVGTFFPMKTTYLIIFTCCIYKPVPQNQPVWGSVKQCSAVTYSLPRTTWYLGCSTGFEIYLSVRNGTALESTLMNDTTKTFGCRKIIVVKKKISWILACTLYSEKGAFLDSLVSCPRSTSFAKLQVSNRLCVLDCAVGFKCQPKRSASSNSNF